MHQRLGAGGVTLAEGGEDVAMFFQRLLEPPFQAQRVAPGELQHLAQVVDDLLQPAVAGELLQRLVEFVVHLEEAVDVALRGLAFQLVVQRFQPLQVGGTRLLRRLEGAAPSSRAISGKMSSRSRSASSVT